MTSNPCAGRSRAERVAIRQVAGLLWAAYALKPNNCSRLVIETGSAAINTSAVAGPAVPGVVVSRTQTKA